jgi:hypothetical protein
MTPVTLPSGSLLEITDHLQALFDTLEMIQDDEERLKAQAEIEAYLEAEIAKVDGVANYLAMCEGLQASDKAEIDRLKTRVATWESRENRMRSYVQMVMERMGTKKLEGRMSTFQLRQSPPSVVITEESEIPDEFKRTTVSVSIDKAAIKKAISSGRDVPGADLSIGGQTLVRK